ncbi:MAG TPA: hypothetical protein VFE65_13515 [Pseudonocardia sp.]|nr:hypothetical protein [Pseudonocardia sp.]
MTLPVLLTVLTGCASSSSDSSEPPPAPTTSATDSPTASPSPSASPTQSPSAGAPGAPGTQSIKVAVSAESWLDNTPPGPVSNDHPIMHQTAGGQGTFADPITVSLPQGANAAYPPGTRFYLSSLQRYVIVEDYGGAPAPPGTSTALSIWIDGRDGPPAAVEDCESTVTASGVVSANTNPAPDLPVKPGPIFANHTCNVPAQ